MSLINDDDKKPTNYSPELEISDEKLKILREQLEHKRNDGLVPHTKLGRLVINILGEIHPVDSEIFKLFECGGVIDFKGNDTSIKIKKGTLEDSELPFEGLSEDGKLWENISGKVLDDVEIIRGLGISLEQKKGPVILENYKLEKYLGGYKLIRPEETKFYTAIETYDPGRIEIKEKIDLEKIIKSGKRVVESSLFSADSYITGRTHQDQSYCSLFHLVKYFNFWKEIKKPCDTTYHTEIRLDDPNVEYAGEKEMVFPDYYEYLVFDDDRNIEIIKKECRDKTLQEFLNYYQEKFSEKSYDKYIWIGNLRFDKHKDDILKIGARKNKNGKLEEINQKTNFRYFEKVCRKYVNDKLIGLGASIK